jgi:acetyltransferase-like isoleucine patch superfamily enzyme
MLGAVKLALRGVGAAIHTRFESYWRDTQARRLVRQGRLEIGAGTYGLPAIHIFRGCDGERVVIGKYCQIGSGVRIVLGGEHRTDWVSTYPVRLMFGLDGPFDGQPFARGDVVIGSDVWIGNDVLVRSGVTIGSGAVIGAASVVIRDVRPYEVVAGNPCRHIRTRFSERQVAALLAIRWWDWPPDRIAASVDLLSSDAIDKFIETFTSTTS